MFNYREITDINGDSVYLKRWSINLPFGLSLKLHCIERSDDDRCHHDHPWWFVRIILSGGYDETCGQNHRIVRRWPLTISWCGRGFQHRITRLHDKRSWSLILCGPRRDSWGFYTHDGWLHWSIFVSMARSARVLWCSDGKERGQQ